MTNDILPIASRVSTSSTVSAIRQASVKTGVDFEYLLETAKRESSLDPSAKAKTSSAAGLFQFIEQTWLGAVKTHGDKHGLGVEANTITRNANGTFNVADRTTRDRILNLRFDVKHAAALAGELAADNRDGLQRKLGKALQDGAAGNGALYAAHFLGLSGAIKLFSADGNAQAAELFPTAAKANRAVFYEENRARTVNELVAKFEETFSQNRPYPPSKTNLPGVQQQANINFQTLPSTEPALVASENRFSTQTQKPITQLDPFSSLPSLSQLPILDQYLSPIAIQVLLTLDPSLLRRDGNDDKANGAKNSNNSSR